MSFIGWVGWHDSIHRLLLPKPGLSRTAVYHPTGVKHISETGLADYNSHSTCPQNGHLVLRRVNKQLYNLKALQDVCSRPEPRLKWMTYLTTNNGRWSKRRTWRKQNGEKVDERKDEKEKRDNLLIPGPKGQERTMQVSMAARSKWLARSNESDTRTWTNLVAIFGHCVNTLTYKSIVNTCIHTY